MGVEWAWCVWWRNSFLRARFPGYLVVLGNGKIADPVPKAPVTKPSSLPSRGNVQLVRTSRRRKSPMNHLFLYKSISLRLRLVGVEREQRWLLLRS